MTGFGLTAGSAPEDEAFVVVARRAQRSLIFMPGTSPS